MARLQARKTGHVGKGDPADKADAGGKESHEGKEDSHSVELTADERTRLGNHHGAGASGYFHTICDGIRDRVESRIDRPGSRRSRDG